MKKSLLIATLLCFTLTSVAQDVWEDDEEEVEVLAPKTVKAQKAPKATKAPKAKKASKKAAKQVQPVQEEQDVEDVQLVEELPQEQGVQDVQIAEDEPQVQDVQIAEDEPQVQDVQFAEDEPQVQDVQDVQFAEDEPQVQAAPRVQSGEVKGAHPYKVEENEKVAPEYAHWSIILRAGFNSFDGDFSNEKAHAFAIPSAGLALEYNFTPVWSIGAEYMYDMYTVIGKQGLDKDGNKLQNADTLLNGHLHRAGVYVAMDFMNLILPHAQKKVFSLIPYIGAGGVWYKRAAYFKDDYYFDAEKGKITPGTETHQRGNTANYINADGEIGNGDYDTQYNMEGYIQAGVEFDCNLNRTLALGLRANYTYFTRDYIDGRGYYPGKASYASKNNDGIFEITANLRFKLEAVSKTHVRNISGFDTWKEKEKKEEQKCCHDTLIIKHDSVIIRETYKQQLLQKEQNRIYYVYFENNKSNLDDKALITIQQVADILLEDTTLYAVVTGYCDNTGSNSLNYALGDKRAANVMDELSAEHGIDTARMYAMGMGKVIGHRSKAAYSPNRRAAIRLVDKATFLRMQQNLDSKRADRIVEEDSKKAAPAPAVKTVPLSESARPAAKPNEYKRRSHETVTTEASTTLSKLARKYYNNTYCWVYIYMANLDKIANPNDITPGIELIIPELTKEEMKITKDESLVLFGNARQRK